MSKGVQIAVGAGVIALLLGWYAASNREALGSYQYYQTPTELWTHASPGERARVHGFVALGSIARDVEAKTVRFEVQEQPPHAGGGVGPTLHVLYESLEIPDLFKDGAEVVVEGSLEGTGSRAVFVAQNVLAKCPSKFEAARTEEARF